MKKIKVFKMSKKNTIKTQETLHGHVNIFENDEIFIKVKDKLIVDDILNDNSENIISSLSSDVGLILSSEFEDLPTHTLNFKTNIRKVISRAITNIKTKNENIESNTIAGNDNNIFLFLDITISSIMYLF